MCSKAYQPISAGTQQDELLQHCFVRARCWPASSSHCTQAFLQYGAHTLLVMPGGIPCSAWPCQTCVTIWQPQFCSYRSQVWCRLQGEKVVHLPPVTEHEVEVVLSDADAKIVPLVRPTTSANRSVPGVTRPALQSVAGRRLCCPDGAAL